MHWFYALDGKQEGPVSDAQLDDLLASKKINPYTLVWREGMSDWQTLSRARLQVPPPVPGQSGVPCSECGRHFPADEVIMLNQMWICGGCKPIYLQRVRERAGGGMSQGLWRSGKSLITTAETPFPDRCVKCNAPANGYRLKRKFQWHSPAFLLLVLVSPLVYIIVALFVRKTAILHIGLCEKHRVWRLWGIAVAWIGVLGGIATIIFGFASERGIGALVGFVVLLGSAIFGAATGTGVSPVKITKENVSLKGVNRDFLDQLPEWLGQ